MRRIFIDGPLGETMIVNGELARHIGLSLRMAVGDSLGVAGADGQCGQAEIVSISTEAVRLKLTELTASPEPPIAVWLAQALPKGDKMEWIIQKAVELGVTTIIPVAMEHSVVKLDEKKAAGKVQRWQTISMNAAKQSKRSIIPEIHSVMNFQDAIEYSKTLAGFFNPMLTHAYSALAKLSTVCFLFHIQKYSDGGNMKLFAPHII